MFFADVGFNLKRACQWSTCPVRVVRSTISLRLPRFPGLPMRAQCSLPDLNWDHRPPAFFAGLRLCPSPNSVRCRTSTATMQGQCSLPDLYSRPSVDSLRSWSHPCQWTCSVGVLPQRCTATLSCSYWATTMRGQCSCLPDRNRCLKQIHWKRSEDMPERMSENMPRRMSEDTP